MTTALLCIATVAVIAAVGGWVVAVHQARRIHALREQLTVAVLRDRAN